MAQFGKASAKRGKPSYIYAIIGVALVLFLFGIIGYVFINLRKSSEVFRENIQLHAYIQPRATKKQIDTLNNYINTLPYAKNVEYITIAKANKKWESEGDSSWRKFLDNSPLPESIDFYVRADYMNIDSISNLQTQLENTFGGRVMSEFQYDKPTVGHVTAYAKYIAAAMLFFTIILSIIVIISIDNTIRLAMYSNRFLIKTMQMVGATRWFIARPLNLRAVANGLIAAGIAIGAIFGFILLAEAYVPWLKSTRSNGILTVVFLFILVLGVCITVVSTHRSVLKYLKMKLDDLY